jgi:hypothetical protein
MAVIVKTDRAKWAQAIEKATSLAKYALAEQMLADSEKFVPYSAGSIQSAGHLRERGHLEPGESGRLYLVWDTVYALYQWFGVRADGTHKVSKYTTPGTGTQWVDKARAAHGAEWQEIVQKHFKEGLDE